MPAKNAELTIRLAVKSVLASFPKDTEVVVWDDGSTDKTAQVASDIDPKRTKILTSPKSVGGGVARQQIIAATDSEFLVNQDSDDVSLPWRYHLQSSMMDGADITFTAVQRFSQPFTLHRPTLPLSYKPHDVSVALLLHNPLSHPTMMAKRTAIEAAGGYSGAPVAQDYDLFLRAASSGQLIRRTGLPGMAYRMSQAQVSQQPDYVARIQDSSQLNESYAHLLANLLKTVDRPTDSDKVTYSSKDYNKFAVDELISTMSAPLRPYYRRLLNTQRLGPTAALSLKVF